MSYYDFDDHFWAPHEVCAQAPQKEINNSLFSVVQEWFRTVFSIEFSGDRMEQFQVKHTGKR